MTSNDYTKYSVTCTIPANATQVAVHFITNNFSASSTTSDGFYLSEVQLEEGSVATPFEQRPYGLELSLCQRYYERYIGNGGSDLIGINRSATNKFEGSLHYKVEKRAIPAIYIFGSWRQMDSTTDVGLLAANIGICSTRLHGNNDWTTSGPFVLYSNDYIEIDAEL